MDATSRWPATIGRIGVARRDVTPPLGIFSGIWGAAAWERSTGQHASLELTALSIAAGGMVQLIVSWDGVAWRRPEDEWAMRSAVLAATGLRPEHVVLQLSHTHAGPSLCPEDSVRAGGEHIERYLGALVSAAVDASREAIDTAVEGGILWGSGSSELAGVRDLPHGNRYVTGWNPNAEADDTVLVGKAVSADGGTLAVLANFACHPTSLGWQNSLISPDFVGGLRAVVEEAVDAPCIYLQGAEGNVAPREQYSRDVALADRHGRGLGHAVLAVLDALPGRLPARAGRPDELAVHTDAATLRLKPVEDIPALAARFWPELDPRTLDARVRRAQWRRRAVGAGAEAEFPVWVWRLGDAFLVAHPGEAYQEFQQELRRRHPDSPILVLSLANGPIWTYFPTADLFDDNLYQVWHTPFEAGGHEAMVELSDRVLEHLGA